MRDETKAKLDDLIRKERWRRVLPPLIVFIALVGMYSAFQFAPDDLRRKLAAIVATAYFGVVVGAVVLGSVCALLGYKNWRAIAYFATYAFRGGSTESEAVDGDAPKARDYRGCDETIDDSIQNSDACD